MISVMNSNECELGRISDLIEEAHARPRVSSDGGGGSSGGVVGGTTDVDDSVNFSVSREAEASLEFEGAADGGGGSSRVLDDYSGVEVEADDSDAGRSDVVRDFGGNDAGGYDREMKSRVLMEKGNDAVDEINMKDVERGTDGFGFQNDQKSTFSSGDEVNHFDESESSDSGERTNLRDEMHNSSLAESSDQKEQMISRVNLDKSVVSDYETVLSNFDDYVANEKHRVTDTTGSDSVGYGFKLGDMVWGKVKSHPWWPGHIFNEAFASSSVRRTRREGHILVAFFGDSSYGWFDPAELVHFNPHYAEKSRQIASRNFVKAVEEAVDEANRRAGLGLICRCRNPYNFRPTSVRDYVAVDTPDYEPAGIYSMNQIQKARDAFRPGGTLSFIKQLAVAPWSGGERSLDWMRSRATVLAYRKAVYEEFDETYAQAFGMQPVRPSYEPKGPSDLHLKEPFRAPLSGPLVMAEALGSGKASNRSSKVKDQAKKDKYLFKRRDEQSHSKGQHISSGPVSSSSQPILVEGSASAAGNYVLQKRAPTVSTKPQIVDNYVHSGDLRISGGAASTQDSSVGLGKQTLMTDSQDLKGRVGPDMAADSINPSRPASSGGQGFPSSSGSSPVNIQQQDDLKVESSKTFIMGEGYLREFDHSVPLRKEKFIGPSQLQDGHSVPVPPPSTVTEEIPKSTESRGKAKSFKRPAGELDSAKSNNTEKKKKRKKEINVEAEGTHPHKKSATGKDGVVKKPSGKSGQGGLSSNENNQAGKPENASGNSSSQQKTGVLSPVSLENSELGLPQVLSDLQYLALNPFHNSERSIPAKISHCVLRFRSVVYQKSLVLSPPSDPEPAEVKPHKPPAVIGTSDDPPLEKVRDLPSARSSKPPLRSDDPTKAGRKRSPSDRQEEIAAKKLKKMQDMKSLAAEKKASVKALEAHRGDGKEVPASTPLRPPARPKVEPPVKAEDPTMLVMKFPPQTSLPSAMELKARFARFGQLDLSGTRVFWKTYTCRVVFKYKSDAQAAYKYAVGNNSLFGNYSVRYHLRELEAPAPELLEPGKGRGEEAVNGALQLRDPGTTSTTPLRRPDLQPSVQLKSCLKKSSGEEAGPVVMGTGGARGTPRVKFMLSGEESSSVGEQSMVGNRNNNASFPDAGTSVAMEYNSKNFQKVISSSSQPIFPFPQFPNPPNNLHQAEPSLPRVAHNYNNPSPSVPSFDISQQMLNLLTRCNDVVSNLKGIFGYVPYHSL